MSRKPIPSLVIVEKRRPGWYVKWGLAILILAALLVYSGRLEDRASRTRLTKQTESLQLKIDELETELRKEQSSKAMNAQNTAVDNMANDELRQTLKTMQDSVKELEKENEFYRGIMNPTAERVGLNIDAFSVLNFGSDNRFRYKLTLTQLRSHEAGIRGKVRVSLSGQENGVAKAYDLFLLAGMRDANQPFDFRYFQNLEGEVVLPSGFAVRDVRVTAVADGRNALERVFAWEQSHVQ